jgi:light-regulated signal transduction histidine kinase (bacteriophytochrome)
MTLKEESVIEMIAYKKDQEEFCCDFPWRFTIQKMSYHTVSIQEMLLKREIRKKKEHLIRELTQNNKDLKQFSYITSHNLRVLYRT